MFTGIIEEIGTVKKIIDYGNYKKVTINCKYVLSDVKLGDSIATDGICLTVEHKTPNTYTAHIMNQTIKMTSFNNLKIGQHVNLERAILPTTRFGGHIVSGHIDYIGTIKNIQKGSTIIFTISTEKEAFDTIINQGSITINGISLTVFNIKNNEFSVSIIPETIKNTNLQYLRINDKVNLETDIVGKYILNITRRYHE